MLTGIDQSVRFLCPIADNKTGTPGPCVGNIAPVPRLNFSGLCLQDGPLAIRQSIYSSVFPAQLSVAASWDRDLTRARGLQIAEEFKGKGSHVILGPVVGPLGSVLPFHNLNIFILMAVQEVRIWRKKLGGIFARRISFW